MATLLEISKRGRKKAVTLKLGDNVDNVDNVFSPPTRGSNGDCVKNTEAKKVFKVFNVITRPFDAEWALAAILEMPCKPSEARAVACRDCLGFAPNPHSPDCGLGACTRFPPPHPKRGRWPGERTFCQWFRNNGKDPPKEGV